MLGLFYNFKYKIRFLFLKIFHSSNFLEYSLCQLSNRVFKVKNKTPFLFLITITDIDSYKMVFNYKL